MGSTASSEQKENTAMDKENTAMDKENVYCHMKTKVTSKIPLPQEPLPPIPAHVRHQVFADSENGKRCPLKSLNYVERPNGPFRSKNGTPLKINTRHVTVRNDKQYSELDWKHEVFRAHKEVTSKGVAEDLISFSSGCKRHENASTAKAVSPAEKSPSAEHNRLRNIKRSLKRPHSRELQGLCAEREVVRFGELSTQKLRFQKERIFDRLRSPDKLQKTYVNFINKDYTIDMLQYLMSKETKLVTPRIEPVYRACIINWLMKVNGADGNPAVIETACWYLDNVLASDAIRLDKLQLTASACYWIAQKLHGGSMLATRLSKFSNNAFHYSDLLCAERFILQKMKFPVHPVIIHDYLPYFAWQCDVKLFGEIEVAASFICLSSLMVYPELGCEYPSIMAAAGVRNALMLLKKAELMPKLLLCPLYRAAEAKGANFKKLSLTQRHAIRTVASSRYEYKAPYDHYAAPPFYVAKKIIRAASNFTFNDAGKNTCNV